MRWFFLLPLAIACMVGVILLVVYIMGSRLPVAHRATRMVRLSESPDVVFAAITGAQDWRNVVKTDLPADGSSGKSARRWREQSGRHSIVFEEVANDRPRLFKTRIADKNLPFGGTWTYEISPAAKGCTCRITEDGEVYSPVFRFVSFYVMGHTKTIDDYLTALGKKFGEPVKIED